MSFTQRKISVTLSVSKGTIGNTGSNTVTVSGLRTIVDLTKTGSGGMGEANVRIFGMLPSLSNELATYGTPMGKTRLTTVQILAGDDSGLSLIYSGTVRQAWFDANAQPEASFIIQAISGGIENVKPIAPTAFGGAVDAVTLLANLAKQINAKFENNGVSVQLIDPYHAGTAWMQITEICDAANLDWTYDNGTLAVWPRNGSRQGTAVEISSATGMIGYPMFTYNGVIVRALLNPSVKFGSLIKVQSSLQPACGLWTVVFLRYNLSAELPGGPWEMELTGYNSKVFGNG